MRNAASSPWVLTASFRAALWILFGLSRTTTLFLPGQPFCDDARAVRAAPIGDHDLEI
jgi:hypothetical protein